MTAKSLLTTLLPLVSDLSRELPEGERYRRLLEAMRALLPCAAAALLRLDGEWLVPLAVDGLSTDTLGRRFKVSEHPRFEALLSSHGPTRFAADSDLPDPYDGLVDGLDEHLEVHDCMGCPLFIDERPWGLLTLDALDTELLRLLNERATLAKEIGVIKNRASLPIYSPDREMKLLRSLVERSEGPLRPESIRAIYREIMSASLALEKDIVISCFGPSGSPAHQAALGRFGSSVRYRPCDSVAEVFSTTSSQLADCGVVPLEEPGHGHTSPTLVSLGTPELHI